MQELMSDRMTGNARFWAGVWEGEMLGFEQMSGRMKYVALSNHPGGGDVQAYDVHCSIRILVASYSIVLTLLCFGRRLGGANAGLWTDFWDTWEGEMFRLEMSLSHWHPRRMLPQLAHILPRHL